MDEETTATHKHPTKEQKQPPLCFVLLWLALCIPIGMGAGWLCRLAFNTDAARWQKAKSEDKTKSYEMYLQDLPNGEHVGREVLTMAR